MESIEELHKYNRSYFNDIPKNVIKYERTNSFCKVIELVGDLYHVHHENHSGLVSEDKIFNSFIAANEYFEIIKW